MAITRTARCSLAIAALLACTPAPVSPPPDAVAPAIAAPAVAPRESGSVPMDMPHGTGQEAPVAATTATPDPRIGETRSVHPGINAPYRARDAVRTWSRRFKRDGREVHDHQAQIVQALGLRPGMAVADLGAGTGLFTLAFAAAVGPGGTVYAVDVIPAFLEHIRGKLKQAGICNVQLVQASDRSAELPPASVDLVFMSDAYHHLEFPQHVLASLRTALRPGGSLWLIDFQLAANSAPALRRHVRAGKAQVLEELAQAGFELVEELPLLQENYVLHLRPVAPPRDSFIVPPARGGGR